ncbi:MAG: adenylosuccinate synthase [Eubacteriales bacterium]|nr:adenylosuccinate synthase [Eubacteriales bacterium]
MTTAVVGANWGDEGKGKITDMLAKDADIVIRYQGGANAGHTIINNYGRFALHTLPSGVFYDHTTNIIGNGVALDITKFCDEMSNLIDLGVPTPKVLISDRIQIVMPYHKEIDCFEEERLKGEMFGSTKSGIAPFYSDKYAKIGFQVSELFDDDILIPHLKKVLEIKNVLYENLYNKPKLSLCDMVEKTHYYRDEIKKYVCDTNEFLQEAIKSNKRILLEGQLGTLKDTDFGIYPMVTSSNTLAGYASVGAGIPPYEIKEIIAVTKAYSSAVGQGEFVSELFGTQGEELRKRGGDKGEYGATTHRPRRVGWYDTVASRYGVKTQGATCVALTVLDVLSYLDEIKVCVAYNINGEETKKFPTTPLLKKSQAVYKTFKGWKCDIRGIREYDKLPKECKEYVEFIEKEIDTKIKYISNGPGRDEIIYRS